MSFCFFNGRKARHHRQGMCTALSSCPLGVCVKWLLLSLVSPSIHWVSINLNIEPQNYMWPRAVCTPTLPDSPLPIKTFWYLNDSCQLTACIRDEGYLKEYGPKSTWSSLSDVSILNCQDKEAVRKLVFVKCIGLWYHTAKLICYNKLQ